MVTPQEAWMIQARTMKEAELQSRVNGLAEQFGWLWYHPADSNKVQRGFPDSTLVKGPRLVFAELKQQTRYPEPEQRVWHERLAAAGAEVYVWRPYDLLCGRIVACLRGLPFQEPLPTSGRDRGLTRRR